MNGENQALDLCSARMKAPDDARSTALISEELVLRSGIKYTDQDAEATDSGHEKEEAPTRKNNGTVVPEESSVQDVESCFSTGSAIDDEDMDIGVDLSLDESGVLESDPVTVRQQSRIVASVASDQDSDKPSDADSSAEAPPLSPSSTPAEQEGPGPKPGGKRVTFPSDEDIVSGSVEPKDPWRHAQNVTVEEILSAYRQACQKLNCKPVPKVLKQVQDLTDLTQRNDCLDLKGEKLDYRACESLEEIFKRVQFKLVDLEQTNLDEDGASALFDMIEYYESATHLNISFNKHIGTRGWQAAAHMMRKTSSLQYLDARNTPLLDHSAPFVARALRISGSLTVLHLESAGLSGRPLMLLATALKMNMNLRELYLADNKLNGLQDSAQLGNLLKFNYNIHILDLRNNHVLDSGLAYICEGLKEQRKGLVTLVLWNNQLTHNGMGYLASALPCTQSLETLNLGNNAIGNEGVQKLKDGLISNRTLLRLGLASTKLSCEGAVAVAEFFAESPRLLRLDLRENEIKTGGLMALSLALKVNTSLLRLDLDREPKKETVKSFIETQRTLLTDIQNGCKRNFILAKEKEESLQQMRQSVSMAEIATEDPPPEEEGDAGDQVSEGQKNEHEEDEEEKEEKEEEKEEEKHQEEKGEEEEEGEKPSEIGDDEDGAPATQDDSDSDTDTDEDEETKPAAQTSPLNQTPPSRSPTLIACQTPPINTPSSTRAAADTMSGIKVTEASVSSGTPSSPGRCFSVSSPGRGHKIFMVTRVESPPEQQQQQQSGLTKPVAQNKTPSGVSQEPQRAERTTTTQETSESKSGESKPSVSTTPSQAQQEPGPGPEPDQETVDTKHAEVHHATPTECKPGEPEPSVSTTVEQPSPSQAQQEPSPSPEPDQDTKSNENTHTEHAQIHYTAPTEDLLQDQLESSEVGPKEPSSSNPAGNLQEELSQHLDSETPNDDRQLDKGTSVEQSLETIHGFSTADDVERVDTAPPPGGTLPNGLKPEFTLHLLEPEAHKAACCVMEHMSVTAELSCGQDLEELLLDASLDASRDAA
ncbi:protein phosphatase 1 regulatory subunit 37 [Clarias gariepinus]